MCKTRLKSKDELLQEKSNSKIDRTYRVNMLSELSCCCCKSCLSLRVSAAGGALAQYYASARSATAATDDVTVVSSCSSPRPASTSLSAKAAQTASIATAASI